MQFELATINSGKEIIVSSAARPMDLRFDRLKHCQSWVVNGVWDSAKKRIASIQWPCGSSYRLTDPYSKEIIAIPTHDRIIPVVRGHLFYNHLFGRYNLVTSAKTIFVGSVSG